MNQEQLKKPAQAGFFVACAALEIDKQRAPSA